MALITFVTVSLLLHLVRGYDSEFGATNLILSIEASIASAMLMVVAEDSAEMQRRQAEQTREMLVAVLSMSEVQQRTLKGILLIAEAQRDMLIDHADLLRALKEGDQRILEMLTKGEAHAADLG
ncbi:hypothetical protein [Paraburkholderia sp. GAS82]|uniref:hypothetical protein n=1 Tax=Paraburkholderia sp. GAS82 TaxID=3035137 RepID=UPI003D24A389